MTNPLVIEVAEGWHAGRSKSHDYKQSWSMTKHCGQIGWIRGLYFE